MDRLQQLREVIALYADDPNQLRSDMNSVINDVIFPAPGYEHRLLFVREGVTDAEVEGWFSDMADEAEHFEPSLPSHADYYSNESDYFIHEMPEVLGDYESVEY